MNDDLGEDPATELFTQNRITRAVYLGPEAGRPFADTEQFRIVGVCPACLQIVTMNMPVAPELRTDVDAMKLRMSVEVAVHMGVTFTVAFEKHLDKHRRAAGIIT